ncbi:MAG: ATP-binding protein [Hyphomicrobiaceae bacterium]
MMRPRFRRLSTQIYLTIVVSLLAVVLVAGATWRRASDLPTRQTFEVAGELAAAALPPEGVSAGEIEASLAGFSDRLGLDLALFDSARRLIAHAGRPLPPPPERRDEGGFISGRGGPAWALALPDGRWLVARSPRRPFRHPGLALLLFLGAIAGIVGIVAFPVVRGLTRRLERLQAGVEQLGQGDLSARIEVKGHDEVARLAGSFNRSAQRIEELVTSHKLLLANASHELRTPLARIRMGVELSGDGMPEARRTAIARDIGELDEMIDELLLLSRLGATADLDVRERVDLLALAAEEASHYEDCTVEGPSMTVIGDPRLLRRLLRNLIENAARHGKPPIAVVISRESTAAVGGGALVTVTDSGPGFTPEETQRMFAPFERGMRRGGAGGSGLGLALVRRIAERHGGTAEIATGTDGRTLNRIAVRLPQSRD